MGSADEPTDEFEAQGAGPVAAVIDPPLIAAGKRLGARYRLERPLGHGGMASVWLATDERLDRQVAVKILSDALAHDDEYLDRFRREAHVVAGLQHPNLVPVYDFGAGGRPYLVMEYIPGGDLAWRAKAGDVPDPESLARELLSALRHIHSAGVLHRDIKPQNVLIDAVGHARLTDFGIAQPRDATALTKTGHVIGTESYIAPEVKEGARASERADLYALGVVLADVAREGAGAGLWELIDRLRDDDPDCRPRSAAAALATLDRRRRHVSGTATQPFAAGPPTEAAAAGAPGPTPFEPSPTGVQRPAPRRRTAVGLLAAGLIVVALVVGLALSGGEDGSGVDVRERGERSQADASGGGADAAPADAPADDAPPAETAVPADEDPGATEVVDAGSSDDGLALNTEGKNLIDAGDPDAAIPVLERAVSALEGSGDELNYNYALFNLANALRLAGRPDEAIPLLEQRLDYPDQQDVVQAELDAALAAAGRHKPGKGPKWSARRIRSRRG